MWTVEETAESGCSGMALQLVRTARSLDHITLFRQLMLDFLMEVVEPFMASPMQVFSKWRFTGKAQKAFSAEAALSEVIDHKQRTFHQAPKSFQVRDTELHQETSCFDVAAKIARIKDASSIGDRNMQIVGEDALAKFLGGKLTPNLVYEMLKNLKSDADTAFFFFKWAGDQALYDHDSRSYNVIVKILASANQIDNVDYVLNEMMKNGCNVGVEASLALVVSYGNCGMVDRALSIFNQLRDQGCRFPAHVYNSIFNALEKLGRYQDVYQMVEKLMADGFVPGESTSDILVRMFCKSGRLDKAVWLLKEMTRKGLQVNPMVFSMVIDSLCKAGKEDSAVCLFEELVYSTTANADTDFICSSLICGIFRTGKVDKAFELIRQLVQGGLICTLSDFSFPEAGKPYSFHEIIGMMKAMGVVISTFVYNCLIEGLCKANKLEEAQEVFSVMRLSKVPADVFTYSSIIDGISKAGRVEEALKLLEAMEDSECKPDVFTYTSIINGFCRMGKFDHAFAILRRMKDLADVVTYNCIVNGFCKASKINEASKVLQDMIEAGCEPDEVTYTTIIDSLCSAEDWDSALKFFALVKKRNFRPSVLLYNRLVHCLCKADSVEAGRLLLEDMANEESKSGQLLGGDPCKPDVVTYNTVIDGLCDMGQMDAAFELLKVMEERGLSADVVTYTSFIHGFCKLGKLDEACKLMEMMVKAGCSPNLVTYNTLIVGLCSVAREQEACGLLQVMMENGCEPDSFTYKILIDNLCKTAKLEAAIHLFNYMKLARCVPELDTYKNLIYGHHRHGRVEEARKLLEEEGKAFSLNNPGKSLVSELHEASNVYERKHLNALLRAGLRH